jgi:hypothetical protein
LGKAFIDGLVEEADYEVQRRTLQDRIEGLVIPEVGSETARPGPLD